MKFSLLYEVQGQITEDGVDEVALYKETLEQCVFADEMGFDYIWLVEHHFLPGFSYCPSPSVFLAGPQPAHQTNQAGIRRGDFALSSPAGDR